MGTLNDLRVRLNACKGSDRWQRMAKMAGCHYFTLARIARGELTNPSLGLVERLFAAIAATEPTKESA